MILSNVNIGTGPSAGDGDPLRIAFNTINQNFAKIQSNVNVLTNSVSSVAGRTGNVTLTINDIAGISNYATITYVNNQLANAGAANIAAIESNISFLQADINTLYGNAGVQSSTLATLTSNAASQAGSLETLTANAASQAGELSVLVANAAVQAGLLANLQSGSYSNANVSAYLTSYNGNVGVGNLVFNDLSVQTTAYTGAQWRSYLTSTLTSRPVWLSYVPGGKNQEGTQYGFDANGMFFAGNADNDFAYPVQTNIRFHENETLEVVATIRFSQANNDQGLAIFNADTRPIWRAGADASRIAFQFDAGIPVLYGQTTANTAPGTPVLSPGNWYTVKFVYNPGTVTVSTFAGNVANGSALDVRTINETLPAGDYSVGFDADMDQTGVKSYFTNLIVRTFSDTAVNDLEVKGTAVVGNVIPSANITYSLGNITHQWKDLFVSNSTIYLNSVPLSLGADNTLLVNNVPVVTFTDGNLSVGGNVVSGGGGAGPVQPYLELTNTPFITQNIVLGNVTTVNAAPAGTNATINVEILEGPILGNVTVNSPGTNYVVGQRYRAYYYNVGGNTNANDDVLFTVANVDVSGGITEISNAQFSGNATNSTGTYTGVSLDYIASVFDVIGPGVTLTRDNNLGLFNANVELQYDNNEHDSPSGTLWNAEGWSVGFNSRNFTTLRSALNNAIGNNILPAELIMWDTINDNYYKFDFTQWGENGNGGFAYTRQLITDPNYFRKTDNGEEVDIIIPDDGDGAGVGITRAGQNGIYNPYRDEGWTSGVSPAGTEWNTDGFDDLSDVTTRTYTNFFAAYGNGGLGNKVPGSQAVMYVPDNGKYYAIEWLEWTQGGNGGGFAYIRRELDTAKLSEGVKFADGTVLKSAAGVGRVKHTASGSRRIEEVAGDKTVAVTAVNTSYINTVTARSATNSNIIWIDTVGTIIDDILADPQNYNNAYNFEFSLDNVTYYAWNGSTSYDGGEQGYGISPWQVTYSPGDTVYFRYKTGGESVVWWDKADLPGGQGNFRGAIISYHAYTGEATIIGTIHIVDDDGEDFISHQEVVSGSTDAENDDLWLVTTEGQIRYRRIDGEGKTLKVQWTAKVFYGSEYYD